VSAEFNRFVCLLRLLNVLDRLLSFPYASLRFG